MGLTTQYHKYESVGLCGLVGSAKSNIVWLDYGQTKGKYCAVGTCENVIVWDVKTNTQVAVLHGEKHEVVKIAASPNSQHLAVGYHNGLIRVFDIKSGDEVVTFSGHKTAISALSYDEKGMLLASGSRDTDIIVWDTVSENGLYRLKGHKGMITKLLFMRSHNILISSSKDTFVKFWDLDTQHCFRTLLTHKTEVYGLLLNPEETRLYTGSADNEMRVYKIRYLTDEENLANKEADETEAKKAKPDDSTAKESQEESYLDRERILSCQSFGSIIRHSKGRTVGMEMDSTGRCIVLHGTDKQVESFLLLNTEEKEQLLKRRASKSRKRLRAEGEDTTGVTASSEVLSAEDELRRHEPIRLTAKPAALDTVCSPAGLCQIVALLANNSISTSTVDLTEKKSEVVKSSLLATPGHRTDVRALCFSNDGTAVASASGEQVKLWNRDSLKCIRTMTCGYALCCVFLPGDRHVVVGCKSGALQLFDVASSAMIEEIDAHNGALWSLCLFPDKRGLVTGSADKSVKFWQFELIADEDDDTDSPAGKRLTLAPSRVLKMSDDVMCVKLSADKRLLAVSLLDNTIKVFFADTLKFFLSLYGHSLPALSIDISTDGTLLVSGSADKNIKIWGLDFGDCHKSIFAHDDSVMGVAFVPKTHLLFTCGKDGTVKQWDADTYNHVTTLTPTHHAEVWSVTVSHNGMAVVSSSHDRSIRLWEKTDEILVLEEQQQEEREREYELDIEKEDNPAVPGETNEEVAFAGKKTVESVKSTERIMEAVDILRKERENASKEDTDIHPILRAFNCRTPQDYILHVLKKIKASELDEALLVMPFDYATDLLRSLDWLMRRGQDVELISKCSLFLLRIHHNQITANQMILPTIERLKDSSCSAVDSIKDRVGFNLSALQLLQLKLEEKSEEQMFTDATALFKKREKTRRKKPKGVMV